MKPYYQDSYVTIYHGDCREVLPQLKGTGIVTDPPYELGFMGKSWDSKGVSFKKETWQIIRESCLPGAMLLSFGGTRTFHRIAVAIEDAGWELRDTIIWLYGSGFPKSLDISKSIDKQFGAEREILGYKDSDRPNIVGKCSQSMAAPYTRSSITEPITPEAHLWEGYGTALKPAWESITVAQNPLTREAEQDIISANLNKLEAQIWSLLPANVAEDNFKLSPAEYKGVCDFAQMSAEQRSSIRDDLFGAMDTSQSVKILTSCLNTVQLWRNIWAEVLRHGNTYTIGTATRQIIDLKTLNSLLLQTTPKSLIQGVILADGTNPSVCSVDKYFSGVTTKLNSIHILSAPGGATSKPNDWGLRPNFEPIILAMNPLDGTFANNALKHGVAGLNIDECRVGYPDGDDALEKGLKRAETPRADIRGGGFHTGRDWGEHRQIVQSGMTFKGRFPANFIHDGSQMVMELFPQSEGRDKRKFTQAGNIDDRLYKGGWKCVDTPRPNDSGSAARFFKCCPQGDYDLLFCRAKAIMEVWNIELANTVDDNSSLSKEHAASALSHVVTGGSRGVKQLSGLMGLSMNVTPRLLRHLCESVIIMTLSSESEYSPVSCLLSMVKSNENLARFAEIPKLTDTMMTMTNPTNIDGFAVIATLTTTQGNMGHGAKDYPARFRYCAKASKSERNAGCEDMYWLNGEPTTQEIWGGLNKENEANKNNKAFKRHRIARGNIHPTVKSLNLMKYLVKLVKMPEYNLIIDPFCGTGTTLLACTRLGVSCIGIDNDEKSCEIAAKRCCQEVMELK